MSHTPGPWDWDGPSDNIHIIQHFTPHIRVCFLTSNGPTKANARLIAAAPDMLAALKEAERYLEYLGGETAGTFVGPGMPVDALAQTRAAIAKAEGRS